MITIGLDFDGTYSADPELFDCFIDTARKRGHEVVIVTSRKTTDLEELEVIGRFYARGISVYATSRAAKRRFMRGIGVGIDIWIDDNPEVILIEANNPVRARLARGL